MPRDGFDPNEVNRLLRKIAAISNRAAPAISKAVDFGVAKLAEHAKARHEFAGLGKGSRAKAGVYKFKNPDGTPRFHIRTGNLVNSIQPRWAKRRFGGALITGEVNVGQEYAAKLEFGAAGRPAFPFLRPALEFARPIFIKNLVITLRRFLKK